MGLRTKKTVVGVALAFGALGAGVFLGAGTSPVSAAAQNVVEDVENRASWVAEALSSLVDDGTIDQDQADAVEERLTEAQSARHLDNLEREDHERDDHSSNGRRSHGKMMGRDGIGLHPSETAASVADLLGVTPEELTAAVLDGESLADLADAKGVPVQDVVDALTAQMFEKIDAAVANERIDPDRATELKDAATERVTAVVNGEGISSFIDGARRWFAEHGHHFDGHGFGFDGHGFDDHGDDHHDGFDDHDDDHHDGFDDHDDDHHDGFDDHDDDGEA